MSVLARGFPLMASDNETNLLAVEVDVSNNGIIFDIKLGHGIPQTVPPSSNATSTVLGSRSAETQATVDGGSSFATTTTIVQSNVTPSISMLRLQRRPFRPSSDQLPLASANVFPFRNGKRVPTRFFGINKYSSKRIPSDVLQPSVKWAKSNELGPDFILAQHRITSPAFADVKY
ncbi:hypothetical protein R3P38DRAFT_3355950 [Favolaschia claudopus]|uniref:Uncharacterized protein n=1 Tax=Favolaschia claudopus TaxID=2862362 RepID=A0AAW0BI13_9AGAR